MRRWSRYIVPAMPLDAPLSRDLRIDLFRGLALAIIMIDHMPGNALAELTLKRFGFSDGAELFVFLSGYAAGLVFGPGIAARGPMLGGLRPLQRAWTLYVAHVFVFVLFTAQVSWTIERLGNPLFAEEMNVAAFLDRPAELVLSVLTLRFQPTHLGILPMYIVLLLWFTPLMTLIVRLGATVALTASAALWAAVALTGLNLPGHDGAGWYFNPFAWQLLFAIGAWAGFRRGAGPRIGPVPRLAIWAAAALVAVSVPGRIALDMLEARDLVPGWAEPWLMHVTEKTLLAPLRLAHFIALAVLVDHLLPDDRPIRARRWLNPLVVAGQNSLPVFCLTIFVAMAGQTAFAELGYGWRAQAAINAAAFALMFGAAFALDWADRAAAVRPARQAKGEAGR